MSASPVVVPFYRAAFAGRAAGWELADALDGVEPAVAVERVREWMADVEPADLDAAEKVDLVAQLERIKSAAAAAQARVTAAFAAERVEDALHASRVEARAAGGDPNASEGASRRRAREEAEVAAKAVRSVGSEIALARRESPSRGDRLVGLARALVSEMPETMAALSSVAMCRSGAQR